MIVNQVNNLFHSQQYSYNNYDKGMNLGQNMQGGNRGG